MFSIKDRQTDAVLRMLNYNKNPSEKDRWEDPWKLLIYDPFCRDVISPLLKVGNLRKQGVTLHLQLQSDRQPVPDVPAIYFVVPNKENVKKICEDCKSHLYDTYHFNFASSIPRPLLEELATGALQANAVPQVAKVYDQYLNFVSLEHDLFSLNSKDSYIAFNDSTISDSQAEANISQIVDALFSVIVTLGVVPIIRCPRNGAAQEVATQLDSRIHDHLFNNIDNLFTQDPNNNNINPSASFQRPVLILLDRNMDLSVMLHHTWTYQALVHDLLNMSLNKVQVEVEEVDENVNKKENKVYDLDASDSFWTQNSATPFQNIAVAVNTYLREYKTAMDEFKKISGGEDIDHFDESKLLGKTKDLGSFVSSIPALREKKRIIDEHTNIATALLGQIKARELDTYFSLEENMMARLPQDRKELLNLMQDPNRGTVDDKMRLFLIYFLNNQLTAAEIEPFEEVLVRLGADTSPLKYLKKIKAFQETMLMPVNANPSQSALTSSLGSVRGLFQKVNVESFGLGGAVTKQLGTLLTAGVKALLPATKELYVTRVADAIMEIKPDMGVDNYLYFDPKIQKKMRSSSIPRKTTPFKEGIVFVIGGGNYVEYQNIQEYAKKQPMKKIIYGSTEIATAKQFLDQLKTLAEKVK